MAQHHLVARGQHVGAGNGPKITGELKTSKEVVDADRRATKSVSRQIGENPVISVLVGCALVVQIKQMIPVLPSSSPRAKRGSMTASVATAAPGCPLFHAHDAEA